MITPNKNITFDESVLSKLSILLDQASENIELTKLFQRTSSKFDDINQFLLTVDVLYVLGRIEIDFNRGTLHYVD
ncbi:ABC-three component system middle component 7 [Gimesia sp.]|uniref:ABC-three component system middle component 7 n=1 Tax=Gimesia sp. TaxID=2024833 RepID=UPI003A90392C